MAPRSANNLVAQNPQAALDYELAQERASTLGRLGRQLETALGALAEFDAAHCAVAPTEQDRGERAVLVALAAVALWHFVVQREVLGLRDSARMMQDYRVPNEVRVRLGAAPAAPLQDSRGRHGS